MPGTLAQNAAVHLEQFFYRAALRVDSTVYAILQVPAKLHPRLHRFSTTFTFWLARRET